RNADAVTAAVLWLTARRLRYSDRIGITLALLYGLGTIAWPYANQFFGEPLSALSLLFCFYAILSFRLTDRLYWIACAGVAAAVAMTTVVAHTVLLAIYGLYLFTFFFYAPSDPVQEGPDTEPVPSASTPRGSLVQRKVLAGATFAVPILLAGLLLLWYNNVRFGNPFSTGYHFDGGEGFTTPMLQGLWGLLVSPYRGVFWYTPLLLIAIVAFVPFFRRHPVEGFVIFGLSFVLLSLYSRWWMWWGGFAWGPRFLVPLTPFWLLPLATPLATIEQRLERINQGAVDRRSGALLRAVGLDGFIIALFALLSVAVQLLAVAVNYVNFEIQLRGIFPTNWADPLEFGPPAQRIMDWWLSPVLGQWYLLRENFVGNNDLAWLRPDGNISVLTLVVGLIAIFSLVLLLSMVLKGYRSEQRNSTASPILLASMPLIPLTLVGVWLGQAATDPHYGVASSGYRAVITEICEQAKPTDVIVTVAPFAYQYPMNWLAGSCRVMPPIVGYGVTNAAEPQAQTLLSELLLNTERIWLVTGGLPANDPENLVERWLVDNAYEADDRWFDDYRLVRYASAVRMRSATTTQLGIPLGRDQTPEITLLGATAPAAATSASILPVALEYQLDQPVNIELHWFVQLLSSENYPVALVDTAPRNGYSNFADLPVAEPQREHVALQLPENLAPGRYRLIAGLYDSTSSTGERLRLPNGRDFVDLQTVTILGQ
ncbi:MAG TPA: hypothetical protein P5121_13205, partial [Caldilineaceae bacterium]|nr:hypothetical protein [Caldilineaceae bacterium]